MIENCSLSVIYNMNQQYKHRRLWRLAVATHPRMQTDWVWAAGSAERDLYNETHCKLRSSAAVGTYAPKMSSLKGDLCFPYIVEDDSRSRFAEPRDCEVMLIPQLRSFGACSGFLMNTCPWGHGADWRFYYGGCVATARRHSLLSLPRQLMNCSLFSWELRMESWELWYVW